MNTSKITFNNKEFRGILDFYVIRKVKEELRENKYPYTVHNIFKNISNIEKLDSTEAHLTINSLVLNSLLRNGYDEEDIKEHFVEDMTSPFDFLATLLTYIHDLCLKCMPEYIQTEDDEFETPDWYSPKDWDFDEFEYMWHSLLKRTDSLYNITPKNFFSQMDIYEKARNEKR